MTRLACCLLCLASLLGSPARAATLHNQPPTWPASRDSKTSQYDGATNVQTFDNFTLDEAGVIRSVRWQGLYVSSSPVFTPAPNPTAIAFFVGFWTDNAGLPGNFLAGQYYNMNAVSQKFLAATPITTPGGVQTTAAMYNYELNVTPFHAAADVPYWLLVQALTQNFQVIWAWTSGSGGDAFSFQNNAGMSNSFTTDRSFAIGTHLLPVAAADFNEDNDVDGNDLFNFKFGFALTGTALHENGDADADQDVDGADLLVWQKQLAVSPPEVQTAPEPTGAVLMAMASLAVTILIRRRQAGRIQV